MARALNLANYNRTTIIDLIYGNFQIDKFSWVTGTADPRIRYDYTPFGAQPTFEYYQPVAEVFNLRCKVGGAAALRAIHELQDVMEGVRRYHDGVPTVESWWLEWNSEDEEPKRALIYTMTMDFPITRDVTSEFMECYGVELKIALTRHPLWETVLSSNIEDENVVDIGGIVTLGTIDGTAPARMKEVMITPTAQPNQNFVEHWLGIRPTHNGVAAFNPLWELELGTLGTDASLEHDATASPGGAGHTYVLITPGTATLVNRQSVSLNQIEPTATERPDYEGRYLVLLRCKVSAGTWGVQMRSGYTDNLIHEEIYIDNAAWYLHELGEVAIPPWAWHFLAKADFLSTFKISIFAERVSGAGTLSLDCLILIPTEHFLYLNGSNLQLVLENVSAHTIENDTNVAYQVGGAVNHYAEYAMTQIPKLWYIPPESGVLVYAGQGATAHSLTDAVEISIDYFPRWLAHRFD